MNVQGYYNPASATPQTASGKISDYGQQLKSSIPLFGGMSNAASQNIMELLSGNVSPGIARNANAYFGVQAGLPAGNDMTSFIDNRGMDLYGQQSAAAKQQGLQGLLAMLSGYSGTVAPTAGQAMQNEQFGQNLSQNQNQFNATQSQNQNQFLANLGLNKDQFDANMALQWFNAMKPGRN